MKQYLGTILLISGIMLALMLGGIFGLSMLSGQQGDSTKRQFEELDLVSEDGEKEEIEPLEVIPLIFEQNKNTEPENDITPQIIEQYPKKKIEDIFQVGKSKEIKKIIDKKVRKGSYTMEQPLWIWNPFGTNNLSMYVSFKTTDSVMIRYTISVEDSSIPDFTRTLQNQGEGKVVSQHNYQITGFVPGIKNYLILKSYNRNNKLIDRVVFSVDVPKLKSGEKQRISVAEGRSDVQISNGLYFAMGEKYIRLYDNSGFIRGEIPTEKVNGQKIEFVDQMMVYAYKKNGIVMVSADGQVQESIDTGNYQLEGDFIYNGYGQIWGVASDRNSNTVSDIIISIDLEKRTVKQLIDLKQLFPNVYKQAKKPKNSKKLDWIGISSLNQQGSDGILISANELSSLIKINNITSKIPSINYIVGEKKIWNQKGNRSYKRYLYEKSGQKEADEAAEKETDNLLGQVVKTEVFESAFGVYDVVTEKDSSLEDGQYYVYFVNNNYGNWSTRSNFSWKSFTNVGTKKKSASNSYFYKYLIDESAGTYDLVEDISISYTTSLSNVQKKQDNKIFYQTDLRSYMECDIQGKEIKKFTLPKKVYRVIKFDLKGYWFQ